MYGRLGEGQRVLLEYKLFEPAFYATDVPDWGTAYAHCLRLGERARVVVESDRRSPLELPLPLQVDRRYGDTVIRIFTP